MNPRAIRSDSLLVNLIVSQAPCESVASDQAEKAAK